MRIPKKSGTLPAIILLPGFGVDCHEYGSFDEIASLLCRSGLLTYQVSFAGTGGSQGKFKNMTFLRQAKQVKDIIKYVKKDKLADRARIGIIAQSCGGASTVLALPLRIKTLLLLSAPFYPLKWLKKKLIEKKIYHPTGITRYPRSNGTTTEIGPQIWKELPKLNIKKKLTKRTTFPTLIMHGDQDPIVSLEEAKLYDRYIHGEKELVVYPGGDHGLDEIPPSLRKQVLLKIVSWFQQTL